MSWGIRWIQENGDILDESLEGIQDGLKYVKNNPAHFEQYEVAIKAVAEIVKSGAVGSPDGRYYVSISGHGNEGHKPTPGWANDSLTIQVTQA